MDPSVRNFLYRNPQYYELVYPEPDEDTPKMCLRMSSRYLPAPPSSILDVGCGTGRDLDILSRTCPDCWGVDYLPEMIEFARSRRPHLHLEVGDMRTVRLGRTFDAIICMGSAFMYALSNEDVDRVLETFVAHSHTGTLLILDIINAVGYLGGGSFKEIIETSVSSPKFSATAVSVNSFDRRRQLLVRRRTWNIPGQPIVEDFCQYRLFFPAELEHLLSEKGFLVAGMFDNKELRESDLSGPRLYIASVLRS
ncbi:MAG: class I SAM-dependent methyltransferase [bacterium]